MLNHIQNPMYKILLPLLLMAGELMLPGFSLADSFIREGISFQVIGSPGNRGVLSEESPGPIVGHGSVGYQYGLSTTEVTVSQYYQFVQAYAKVNDSYPDARLLGRGVFLSNSAPSGYGVDTSLRGYAATLTWRNAARFCNWLQNGKVNAKWAFESGAYDVSTFNVNPSGSMNDQVTRSPDAKFWIPNLDEWIKGVYFDPNRYGTGQSGYWQCPGGRSDLLAGGLPSQAGESDAPWDPSPTAPFLPAGSYPKTSGPWGLLDTSGGEREWNELVNGDFARAAMGSERNDQLWAYEDAVNWQGMSFNPEIEFSGLRLATSVPSPSTIFPLLIISVYCKRNRE